MDPKVGMAFVRWVFLDPARTTPGKLWKEELDYAWFLTIKASLLSACSVEPVREYRCLRGVSHVLHGLTVV